MVLFDGMCNLCNGWVDFLIRHDSGGTLRFSALQSPETKDLLGRAAAGIDPGDTVVLVDREGVWTESEAVVRIVRRLPLPYRMMSVFRVLPRPIRDRAYRFVARRRYGWFGKRDACRVPRAEERDRFL